MVASLQGFEVVVSVFSDSTEKAAVASTDRETCGVEPRVLPACLKSLERDHDTGGRATGPATRARGPRRRLNVEPAARTMEADEEVEMMVTPTSSTSPALTVAWRRATRSSTTSYASSTTRAPWRWSSTPAPSSSAAGSTPDGCAPRAAGAVLRCRWRRGRRRWRGQAGGDSASPGRYRPPAEVVRIAGDEERGAVRAMPATLCLSVAGRL